MNALSYYEFGASPT